MKRYTRLLTIAGSDSGGGAGIQADLKTFSACGCYGMSVITAVTAQNTQGVMAVHPVPVSVLAIQIRAVLDDIGVDGIKIGMLHSTEVIICVAELLKEYDCEKVVFDPVMVATSGDPLIEIDAVEAMKEYLFPRVDVITPNIPEAQMLLGRILSAEDSMIDAAMELARNYSSSVLLKGGHLEAQLLEDILVTTPDMAVSSFSNPRVDTKNSHGTGCTLSSAIASYWSRGGELHQAVENAENYLHGAIKSGAEFALGKGHGPVHHFYNQW